MPSVDRPCFSRKDCDLFKSNGVAPSLDGDQINRVESEPAVRGNGILADSVKAQSMPAGG